MTIKRRDFLKKAGTGAAGVAALGACGGGESAASGEGSGIDGPRVNWRLATSFPPSRPLQRVVGP